ILEIVVAAGAVAATGATSEAGTSAPASRHATELTELPGQTAAELGHPEATSAPLSATATFFSGTVAAVNAELFTQSGPQLEPPGAELFTQQTRRLAQAVAVCRPPPGARPGRWPWQESAPAGRYGSGAGHCRGGRSDHLGLPPRRRGPAVGAGAARPHVLATIR